MRVRARCLLASAMAVAAVTAGCGGGGQDDAASETTATSAATTTAPTTATASLPAGAKVSFTEPADGATVNSPVKVKMQATNFAVEPAGEIKPGAGHFHIIVDGGCLPPGQVIPNDATHLHYGKAQTEAELMLSPGSHTLCLQMGDGAHTALELTQTITVTVSGS